MNISGPATTGLSQAFDGFSAAAERLAGSEDAPDDINLSADVVRLLGTENVFTANLEVLQKADEMEHQAISLIA